jgi:hypothetical protein
MSYSLIYEFQINPIFSTDLKSKTFAEIERLFKRETV